jgi:Thylakoid formation protein.
VQEELPLLRHQTQFRDGTVRGRPRKGLHYLHARVSTGKYPDGLFEAICSSNGFDADALKREASQTRDAAASAAMEGITTMLAEQRLPEGSHYSRMMAIGLLTVLKTARGKKLPHTGRAEKSLSISALTSTSLLNGWRRT